MKRQLRKALRAFGRVEDALRGGVVHRERLVDIHVLAGVQRVDDHLLVLVVGGADAHHVDARVGEDHAVVACGVFKAQIVLRLLRLLDGARAHAHELRAEIRVLIEQRQRADRQRVRAAHESPADDADSDGFHIEKLLPLRI